METDTRATPARAYARRHHARHNRPAASGSRAFLRLLERIGDDPSAAPAVPAGWFPPGSVERRLLDGFAGTVARLREGQRRLRESEERFALAMRGTNDGLWDWDVRTGAIYFSPRWKQMLGHEDHELPDRLEEWSDRIHPDDRERALATVQAYLRGETEAYELEHRLRHKDGAYRWIRARGALLRDTAGRPCRFAGSHTDITERKAAEEALRASEARFRTIFESAGIGVVLVDPEGRVMAANPAVRAMLGYGEAELLGRTSADQTHPDDLVVQAALTGEMLRGERDGYQLEKRYIRKDGRVIWGRLTVSLARGAGGEPLFGISTIEDISERKAAEEALGQLLAFEGLITSISTAFINLAPDEIDRGINDALGALGALAEVDRSYVFLLSGDQVRMSNTHEWCAAGIKPEIDHLQDLRTDTFNWCNTRLLRGEVVHIPRVADLPPEADADRRGFEAQDIQSVLLVPMMSRGKAIGFLGFDAVRAPKGWSDESIRLLTIVGEIFVNALARKRVEEALRESEGRFRSLVEQTPLAIVIYDPGGRAVYANPAQRLLTGLTDEEQVTRNPLTSPRIDAKGLLPYIRRGFAGEVVGLPPARYAPDEYPAAGWGRPRWLRSFIYPVKDEAGAVCEVIAMHEDITEQREAEERLREKEEQYRAIFEATGDGLVITDLDGTIVEANPALCRMHGYEREELLGLPPTALIHPTHHHLLAEYLARVREGGTFQTRAIDVRQDGTPFHVEMHGSRFTYLGKPHILGVIRDVTEQVQAYQLLERRVAERTQELATLLVVSHRVASTLELAPLLGVIFDQLKVVADYTSASILALEGEELVTLDFRGPIPREQGLPRAPLDRARDVWETLRRGQPVIVADARADTPEARAYRAALGPGRAPLMRWLVGRRSVRGDALSRPTSGASDATHHRDRATRPLGARLPRLQHRLGHHPRGPVRGGPGGHRPLRAPARPPGDLTP